MKTIGLQLMAALVAMSVLSSCGRQPPGERFVREVIPVVIEKDQPVVVEIRSLSVGLNNVGIRCPIEVWTTLTNSAKGITVHLKSSSVPDTQIGGIDTASGGTSFIGYIPNAHYLFYISGEPGANATVEITFPNAPRSATGAEIIVCKTPAETEP
jgi:hypothetical protein